MWGRALLTPLMSRAQRYLRASCIAANPPNFAVQPWTKTLWQHSAPTLSCYQSHPHQAAPHKQVSPRADITGKLKNAKGGGGRASIIIGHSPESEVPSAPTPGPPCPTTYPPAHEGGWRKHPAGRTGRVSLCFRVGGKKKRETIKATIPRAPICKANEWNHWSLLPHPTWEMPFQYKFHSHLCSLARNNGPKSHQRGEFDHKPWRKPFDIHNLWLFYCLWILFF